MSSSFGVHFISTMVRWGGGGRRGGRGGHSKMMLCVHNLPLPGKRREDTRAVTVETDNNNNIQKSSGRIEKTYVRKKWWTKKKETWTKRGNEKQPSRPVAERKPCDRSRSTVTYKYQLWDNNLASTFKKRTTNTNQKGWQRSRHKSRKCQKLIWY